MIDLSQSMVVGRFSITACRLMSPGPLTKQRTIGIRESGLRHAIARCGRHSRADGAAFSSVALLKQSRAPLGGRQWHRQYERSRHHAKAADPVDELLQVGAGLCDDLENVAIRSGNADHLNHVRCFAKRLEQALAMFCGRTDTNDGIDSESQL